LVAANEVTEAAVDDAGVAGLHVSCAK